MSPTRQEVQAEIVKAARKGQEVVIEVIKTSAGVVRSARTQVNVPSLPFADRLPKPELLGELAGKLPKPEELAGNARQFAEKLSKSEALAGALPKAEELAANARRFAEKLLASQQKFAEDARRRATAALLPTADQGSKADTANGATAESPAAENAPAADATAADATVESPAAEASTPKATTAEASTPEVEAQATEASTDSSDAGEGEASSSGSV
jgi:hypothetical protein